MLDNLAPWLRHLLIAVVIAPVAGFAGIIVGALVANGGFDGFDWPGQAYTAANASAVVAGSGLLGWLALYVTPLTRQYGVGATPDPVGQHEKPADPDVLPEDL